MSVDRGPGGHVLLEASGLRVEADMGGRRKELVTGIDFTVRSGETVGIVGESGSGKSLTARAMLGLLPVGLRMSGELRYQGHDLMGLSQRQFARYRGREIGMVFQDPFTMLNPTQRAGRHIEETLRHPDGSRLGKARRRAEAVQRLAEVGIVDPDVADRYPFELSGGMRQRVGIAAALAPDPSLLVADEPTTALDVTTQKEILALLRGLQETRNMGLVLITHDLNVAFSVCDRIYVLYAGRMIECAPSERLRDDPHHPYTMGLLMSDPPMDVRLKTLQSMKGSVPAPADIRHQCAFADRCRWVQPQCREGYPALAQVDSDWKSACIRLDDILPQMRAERAARHTADPDAPTERAAAPLLSVDGVSKIFSRGSMQVHALKKVTVDIDAGTCVGLVGESGSGKTTLGRCLVGLEHATAGTITLDGRDITHFDRLSKADLHQVRSTVQMVFQDPYSTLSPARSIGGILGEVCRLENQSGGSQQTVPELLEQVGLPAAYAKRKPSALSGGERQRVAIARALARRPRLMVCDEVVSALDVSVQAQILNLLKSLRDELGIAMLFITHDLAVVRQVADRVYVLYHGQVMDHGDTTQVLDHSQDAYTQRLIDSVPARPAAGPASTPSAPVKGLEK